MTVLTEKELTRLKTIREVANRHDARQAMIKRRRAEDAIEEQERRKRDEL